MGNVIRTNASDLIDRNWIANATYTLKPTRH